MTTSQRSRSRRRTAVTLLIGTWAVSPVACGGRTSPLEGDDFSVGGAGPISGGSGGTSVGGAPSFGGRFTKGGFGGAPTTGGVFTSGGSKSGRGGASSKGGSGGWEGGAPNVAGWDGGGVGGFDGNCPPNNSLVYYVDPFAGSDINLGGENPTGVRYPLHCRYRRLTDALNRVPAGGQVLAVNDGKSDIVAFTWESLPLKVPRDVTLSGLFGSPPGRFQIMFSAQISNAVILSDGATFEGFTIENVGTNALALVECNPQASVVLRHVNLRGGIGTKVAASLGCFAEVSDFTVSGAGVGLQLPSSPSESNVYLQRATIDDCTVGIEVSGQLDAYEVNVSNGGDALVVNSGATNLWQSSLGWSAAGRAVAPRGNGVVVTSGDVSLNGTIVSSNAGAGVFMSGGTLRLVDSDVVANGNTSGLRATGSGVHVQGATAVAVFGGEIRRNAMHGLHLPSEGKLNQLNFENATVAGNSRNGVQLDGFITFGLTATNSRFVENGSSGIEFNRDVSFLEKFFGNRFAANLVSQLAFNVPSATGSWRLGTPGTGCSQANVVSCYGGMSRGIVAATAAVVDAGYVRWHSFPPTMGVDFAGPVIVHDTCSPGAACDF